MFDPMVALRRLAPHSGRPAVTTCFGGGGAFGIGFIMGAVQALSEHGLHVQRGSMIGTSAGSWSAATLAVGASFEDMVQCWERHCHGPRPLRAADLTCDMFGTAKDSRVSAVAVRLRSGRRCVLSGAEHPLADIVAASSSVPRLATPHVIDGRRYYDGGTSLRATSADLAPAADLLVVVSPIARGVLGSFGTLADRTVRLEMARWRLRTGGRVVYIRPDAEVARLAGRGTSGMLDIGSARPTYHAAREMTARLADTLLVRDPDLATVAA